jgi:hypothetical protein
MTPSPQRAEPLPPASDAAEPLDLTTEQMLAEQTFDEGQWAENRAEERGKGGRQVLGWTLSILAALWLKPTRYWCSTRDSLRKKVPMKNWFNYQMVSIVI